MHTVIQATDIKPLGLPDYDIKEPLGEGGMATVYLAIHKRLEREVALKIMSPETAANKAFQKSFISEGRTVAKLEHPNIVKVYDIDVQNGLFYMSMELLRKGSLKQRLANGRLPLSNALRIVVQVANALSYAHNKGYIHRDIKPANIMFREDGSAVLTDFGIAKMQGTTSDMTQMGYIAGTPYYMAPEQAMGNQDVDQRADIYSLCIMFYEMLTGEKPYTGSNTVAITYEHVHGAIPKLESEYSIFQPAIEKALAKKPDERFRSMEEFSQALIDASKADAQTLLLTPALAPVTSVVEKKPIWPWLLTILIIGGGSIWGTYLYSKTNEEKRIAEAHAKLKQEQAAGQAKLEKEKAEKAAALMIEQERLATENARREAEEERLAAQRAREQEAIQIEKRRLQDEKVSSLLSLALTRDEKRRVFDFSRWSEGCKTYLREMDGPYEAEDSSESHYRQVLELDQTNALAREALSKIENRRQLEFSNCDNYKPIAVDDPLKGLFKN